MERQTTAQRLRFIMEQRNLKQTDIIRMAEPYCAKYRIKLGKSDMSHQTMLIRTPVTIRMVGRFFVMAFHFNLEG